MPREYTPVPFEFLEEMDLLSDEDYGRLIRAMQRYSMGDNSPPTGQERLFWKRAKNVVDRFTESYENRRKSLRENGSKGGRPPKSETPEGENQTVSKETKKNLLVFSETKKSQSKTKPKPKPKPEPKEENTPQKPPTGGGAFEAFWAAYPRKNGKLAAKRAFDRVHVPIETLVTAIRRQECSAQWTAENGRFIPNPATWLNQGRWEDEVEPVQRGTNHEGNIFLEMLEEGRDGP